MALEFDIVVVGAGPAGIAAACAASESGARAGVVDANPAAGGQIWRGEAAMPSNRQARAWLERLRRTKVEVVTSTHVLDRPAGRVLLADRAGVAIEIRYGKIIIATGARERWIPFPGWTLPNVMGAGGLQALVKGGLPIEGKRVIVAGTGPLLIAVAAYLKQHGAEVPVIAEQTSTKHLTRFVFSLAGELGKLFDAIRFRWALRGSQYLTGCWPVAAEGKSQVEAVVLQGGGQTRREGCDYLACGFGLAPNLELARLLGCEVRNGTVAVNEWQETSVEGVWCAGEPTGIGGVEAALVEGEIAGYDAAGLRDRASVLFGRRAAALAFANTLDRAFALREELRQLPRPDTIVCRCEDVPYERLRTFDNWRAAKLQTRCGMGPCQGRVCGSAIEWLLGWPQADVRPPLFPAPVSHLTAHSESDITVSE
ncbi:MAG: FAD-dependent oxidoreductase [Bryobacteraceae bacterium]